MTLETQIDAPAIDSGAILAEFDTLDRLSYIGRLYREIDLIDFSAPVIEYLVNNPIPKQAEIKVEKISATVTKSDLGFMSYDDTIRHMTTLYVIHLNQLRTKHSNYLVK